jgi:ubiquinone/menaquinone biosynthesis C-methylase UbiE
MMNEDPTILSIGKARKCFNDELHSKAYALVHADNEQLQGLLSFLAPKNEQVFLDLGTGNGYVGMSLAQQFPGCSVIGLDIAERALQQNVDKAKEEELVNIRFQSFDGIALPLADGYLDGLICRYAFHHFPEYEKMLHEISRTVRAEGRFVLSDPVKQEMDTADFINSFQALKQDGHVKIHKRHEFLELVERYGFEVLDSFDSTISFSRNRRLEYDKLLDSTPPSVLDAYRIKKDEKRIWITFEVMNLVFQKNQGDPNGMQTDARTSCR